MIEGQNNAQEVDRAGLIAQCAQTDWDIVVIGGGITGAGILLEAALAARQPEGAAVALEWLTRNRHEDVKA